MLLKLVAIPVDVSRILQKKSVEAVDLVMKASEERLSGSRDGLRRTTEWAVDVVRGDAKVDIS